ncbi:MAG: ATP synthase F0, B subunit [Parcubacteria group bacterium GW2011_GWC1_35_8]|uniref:ATP synthase subunit b n=3 Tax=Candidatus Nomuraibacteriota TaxID=1752729 RepID=A0A1F6YWM0_9BACT|nr:MAG: ATP synthase F0, B subunit [Parcubacteria group bacterium GW2011_GWC1_35_8]KKP89595.1 MAG: ATP synthase F0, B subunit [Candidatus Nomurabacteria bacterium GW2011_GWC2_35_8]OGJ04740.1 MAG: hypothetical protein A2238_01085 [Candidatus Nomurabacteria bacterium RIFOXYA2_FULL_35_9]OGJ06608.1 MAG: hypothetical protein A2192_00720 [Candidatus Nomurabacteria bacterium RIFOXYA1_FULL_35_17]OGJ10758.1 MAG: hypothetical protein A2456_02910 [Candidatus Nomurabacteria bacterium RIFOXYC2_FULL_36_19]O
MDSIISTFHIDWKIIIAQAINFIIVFVVLYMFALKPLGKLMAERTEKIKKGLIDSKKANGLLEKAGEEYKENTIKLRKISADAQKELQKDLEKLKIENLERIKKDNDEWNKKRIIQMEIDKKAIVESARKEIVDIAMKATEKILGSKKDLNNL